MDTKYLWLQQRVQTRELVVSKIHGLVNGADLMTKGLDGVTMKKHCESMGLHFAEGRHETAPQLAIPAEIIGKTASLLAALMAVMPVACQAVPIPQDPVDELDPYDNGDKIFYVLILSAVLLILGLASLLIWFGTRLGQLKYHTLELKYEAVRQQLRSECDAYRRAIEYAKAAEPTRPAEQRSVMPDTVWVSRTGHKAHTHRECCAIRASVEVTAMPLCKLCTRMGQTSLSGAATTAS